MLTETRLQSAAPDSDAGLQNAFLQAVIEGRLEDAETLLLTIPVKFRALDKQELDVAKRVHALVEDNKEESMAEAKNTTNQSVTVIREALKVLCHAPISAGRPKKRPEPKESSTLTQLLERQLLHPAHLTDHAGVQALAALQQHLKTNAPPESAAMVFLALRKLYKGFKKMSIRGLADEAKTELRAARRNTDFIAGVLQKLGIHVASMDNAFLEFSYTAKK